MEEELACWVERSMLEKLISNYGEEFEGFINIIDEFLIMAHKEYYSGFLGSLRSLSAKFRRRGHRKYTKIE